MLDGPTSRRFVTVPIERGGRGGLVVDDLPSFASAPPRAAATAADLEPLFGPERTAIVDVLTPFLRAYLAGDTAGLAYLVPPGDEDRCGSGPMGADRSDLCQAAGPATRAGRVVLVAVQARDVRSRADVRAALSGPARQAGSLVRG